MATVKLTRNAAAVKNMSMFTFIYTTLLQGSSVGTATGYGLDGPEIETR
jgi:hypothetical protein